MIRNPYGKLNKIIEKMKANEAEEREVKFSDDTSIMVTDYQIGEAIDSVVSGGEANEIAKIYIDKFAKGIIDEEGNCYLIDAFNVDQERLWSDEE